MQDVTQDLLKHQDISRWGDDDLPGDGVVQDAPFFTFFVWQDSGFQQSDKQDTAYM